MAPLISNGSSFDPLTQPFQILQPDGNTTYTAYVSDIIMMQSNAVQQAIMAGTQIGVGLTLLVLLLALTKADKRRSLLFSLNVLALLLVAIRGIIDCAIFTGPFYNWYFWEVSDYSDVGNAKAVSASAEVITFLLILLIEVSLMLQVRIASCNAYGAIGREGARETRKHKAH